MIAVRGTYKNGKIKLDKEVKVSKTVKVIVTFLEDEKFDVGLSTQLNMDNFSFKKARVKTKGLKSSLSDEIIQERRLHI
ncbi:MAG: hypothetical protein ACPGTO_09705 [Polaribacter sp.]